MSEVVWLRVGDDDSYQSYDDIMDAADALAECHVKSVERCGIKYGVQADFYSGNNYISIYCGENDRDATPLRELSEREINYLNKCLEEWSE